MLEIVFLLQLVVLSCCKILSREKKKNPQDFYLKSESDVFPPYNVTFSAFLLSGHIVSLSTWFNWFNCRHVGVDIKYMKVSSRWPCAFFWLSCFTVTLRFSASSMETVSAGYKSNSQCLKVCLCTFSCRDGGVRPEFEWCADRQRASFSPRKPCAAGFCGSAGGRNLWWSSRGNGSKDGLHPPAGQWWNQTGCR